MIDALIFILGAASGAFATALLFCLPTLGSTGTPPIYNVTHRGPQPQRVEKL